jgi:hypothetical protein
VCRHFSCASISRVQVFLVCKYFSCVSISRVCRYLLPVCKDDLLLCHLGLPAEDEEEEGAWEGEEEVIAEDVIELHHSFLSQPGVLRQLHIHEE